MNRRIRLKESLAILKETENIYVVVFTATRRIKRFQTDTLIREIIDITREEGDYEKIVEQLSQKYSNVELAIRSLEHAGILRIRDEEIDKRDLKQTYFIDELTSSWDETKKLRDKLKATKVAVFGVGGIGTWIVNGLYQMGLGKIVICDPDVVEASNLNRQLFFTSKDVGRYKVEIIKEKLSDANIEIYRRLVLKEESLDDIIEGSDFIVNCADKPSVAETSNIIDQYATKFNIPYCVCGGYNLHLGMVGPIIVPGQTATFSDFLEYQKRNDPLRNFTKIKDVEESGNLGPIAGAVANIQLVEIFKYFIGKGQLMTNQFAEVDFLNFDISWRKFDSI